MSSIANLVYLAFSIYAWMIIIQVALSWFRPRPGTVLHRVYRLFSDATEPYIDLFRRLLPAARIGGAAIDFSPVLALIALYVVMQIVARF